MSSASNKFMLDGFSTVQAVRRAAPRRKPPGEPPPSRPAPEPERKTHAGRTALPSRTDILCYACGYGFVLSGRVGERVLCPKCRVFLETGDYTLVGAESDLVRTIGTVTVAAGAVLDEKVRIVSRRLRVAGDVRRATAECRDLDIEPGGQLDLERVTFRNLRIAENAHCRFEQAVVCRTLEVLGWIDAAIQAGESVRVHAGACVTGAMVTPRLMVLDGARLCARLAIGAAAENPVRA